MVRNPRTLMVCSLLALATGLALGSRLVPTAGVVASGAAPTASLADRLTAWRGDGWARRDAPVGDAIPVDAEAAVEPIGLEGDRHPRMPRMSRESMARAAR